jgi:hypothetical protein
MPCRGTLDLRLPSFSQTCLSFEAMEVEWCYAFDVSGNDPNVFELNI